MLAQEEARALLHGYIGTEHIMLELLLEDEGVAARVLESLGITLEMARTRVVAIIGPGEDVTSGQIPFTPRAKKVLELALREALSLGHNYIGTEHIRLGLVRENDGVGPRVLLELGADSEKIRAKVISMLSGSGGLPPAEAVPASVSPARGMRRNIDSAWLDGLAPLVDRLAGDIRQELGREQIPGDLLLTLARTEDTVAARALRELGVDLDALWGTIETVRRQQTELAWGCCSASRTLPAPRWRRSRPGARN